MKKLKALIPLLLIVALLCGCAPQQSESASQDQSTTSDSAEASSGESSVTIAIATDIGSPDPRQATNTNNAAICTNIFSSLLKTDSDYNIVVDAAESYEYVDDVTYKFTLKKGILFHDGTEMTSEDVQYSFDTLREEGAVYRLGSDFNFMYIETIDDYNFYLKMDEPNSSALLRLCNVKILPKHYVEEVGDEAFAAAPIGSGPYKFVSWTKDEKIVLEAFDDYFDGKPAIDTVTFKIIPESSARVAALEAGEVDLITAVSTNQVSRLEANENLAVTSKATTRMVYFSLNTLEEGSPIQNLKVRQAINYAIDRDAIVSGVLDGYGTPACIYSLPLFNGYDDELEGYKYDPEYAKTLLEKAGYADGFELEIGGSYSGLSNASDVVQAIAAQLGEVGITATVVEKDSNIIREEFLAGTSSEMTFTTFGGDTNDICYMNQIVLGTGQRYSAWADSTFDELLATAISSTQPDKQDADMAALQEYVFENACVVPLYQSSAIFAYNTRLQGWEPRADEKILLYGVSVG